MRFLYVGLAAAVAVAAFFFWKSGREKEETRSAILEKAREAKAAKALEKNLESPEGVN